MKGRVKGRAKKGWKGRGDRIGGLKREREREREREIYIYIYIYIYMPTGPFAAAKISTFWKGKGFTCLTFVQFKAFLGPKSPTNLTFKPKMNQ